MASVSTSSFDIFKVAVGAGMPVVAVVSFKGLPSDGDWVLYERAYLSLYRDHNKFIIIFDTRNIDFPTLDVIQNKKVLLQTLKHRTVGQVPAVLVLTQFDIIKQLVLTVIRAGGQAAPFFISTLPEDVVQYATDVATAVSGRNVPHWWRTRPGLVSIGDTDRAVILALVLQQLITFSRHFVRYYFARKLKMQ